MLLACHSWKEGLTCDVDLPFVQPRQLAFHPLCRCLPPRCTTRIPPPPAEESDYHLLYSDKGSRVCLVASEPVTSAANDWVEVPANTALVVCREKGGILNILLSPITLTSDCARHEEVARCLEAVNHTAAFGTSTMQHHSKQQHHHHPQLPLVRSLPSMHRLDSDRLALDAPTDSEDSGPVAVPPSPGCHHGHSHARHSAARAAANGPLAYVGEDDRLTGHASSVMSLTCANGLLFSGGTDSTIRVRLRGRGVERQRAEQTKGGAAPRVPGQSGWQGACTSWGAGNREKWREGSRPSGGAWIVTGRRGGTPLTSHCLVSLCRCPCRSGPWLAPSVWPAWRRTGAPFASWR